MSQEWITITDSDVFAAGNKERQSIVAVKGQDDLAATVASVTALFRDAISARGSELGDAGTVPAAYRGYVIALALWNFVTNGVPKNEGIQTKQREDQAKDAQEFLKSLRDGTASPTSTPSFCRPRRKFTECDEDGI